MTGRMTNGIDHKAFTAELRKLDPVERQRRSRQLNDWLRAAARSRGGNRPQVLTLACVALMAILAGAAYVTGSRFLFAGAMLLMVPVLWFGLASNRGARQWRREHPFDQWSGR